MTGLDIMGNIPLQLQSGEVPLMKIDWKQVLTEALESEKDLNPQRLSTEAGLNPTYVRDLLKKESADPGWAKMMAILGVIAEHKKVKVADLLAVNEDVSELDYEALRKAVRITLDTLKAHNLIVISSSTSVAAITGSILDNHQTVKEEAKEKAKSH